MVPFFLIAMYLKYIPVLLHEYSYLALQSNHTLGLYNPFYSQHYKLLSLHLTWNIKKYMDIFCTIILWSIGSPRKTWNLSSSFLFINLLDFGVFKVNFTLFVHIYKFILKDIFIQFPKSLLTVPKSTSKSHNFWDSLFINFDIFSSYATLISKLFLKRLKSLNNFLRV